MKRDNGTGGGRLPKQRHVSVVVERIAKHVPLQNNFRLVQPYEQAVARPQATSNVSFFQSHSWCDNQMKYIYKHIVTLRLEHDFFFFFFFFLFTTRGIFTVCTFKRYSCSN